MKCSFFNNYDWNSLENKTMKSPYIPPNIPKIINNNNRSIVTPMRSTNTLKTILLNRIKVNSILHKTYMGDTAASRLAKSSNP